MSTSLKSVIVKTKKQHQCFSCLRIFPSNTKMNYSAGIYEGDFSAGYSCMTCVDIMNRCEHESEGYSEGFVREMLEKDQTPEQLLETWDKV